MCAPISDGAAAAVVYSKKGLLKMNARRAIKITGISLTIGPKRAPEEFERHIGRVAATATYTDASINPSDIDIVEVHDATAYSEMQQIENLQLCSLGDGGVFTEMGHSKSGGKVPVNPSGGLVSKGHPVGATGIIQIHELMTQLRGEAGK
jgi:acetyl-CoA acetyltransferase